MTLDRNDTPATANDGTVFVVFELSKSKWLLGVVLPGANKLSRYTVAGGETSAVKELLDAARRQAAALGHGPVRVVSAYEAGYDGFWLHRWLEAEGVESHVLDPSSVSVDRRARRAKTDRLDMELLMRVLLAHCRGEPRACRMVRPPSIAEEDARRSNRERTRLVRERVSHTNRIKGLLHGQGIRDATPLRANFRDRLDAMRTGAGHALAPKLVAEIEREHARLGRIVEQIAAVDAESRATVSLAEPGSQAAKVARLAQLKGIGERSAQVLVNEVFYRDFSNRREVGSYFGLTGTPYNSGQSERDQGISKAGNRRARALAVELAWLWLRHQPDSALSHWFTERVRDIKGRVRRISIVALTRKLMVALWRFLETGLVPTGARLRIVPHG